VRNPSRSRRRRVGANPVGWQRDHGDFTPEGRLEQTQKFAQSARYMRENGIRIARPPAALVVTAVVVVAAVVVLAALVQLLF
jgi:hypothetical protein